MGWLQSISLHSFVYALHDPELHVCRQPSMADVL